MPDMFSDWSNSYKDQSLPFIVATTSSPEVVSQMVHRSWLVDFNEKCLNGIPLLGHLYAKSALYDSSVVEPIETWFAIKSPSDVSALSVRFQGCYDFAPICAALISMGADPWQGWSVQVPGVSEDAHGMFGEGQSTLLHCAVAKSDLSFTRFLLSQKSLPAPGVISQWNFTNKDGVVYDNQDRRRPITTDKSHSLNTMAVPLLHMAANKRASSAPLVVKELVQKAGLDPNCRDCLGRTPIFYARSTEMVEQLMSLGADPFVVDNQNFSLRKFWETHLGTSKTSSDFYGVVLSIASKTLPPEELRRHQSPELLKALFSGNKTTVKSLFGKAKFQYSHRFNFSGSQISWNLLTPVLLRTDVIKSTPIIDWLSPKVSWQQDLGGGATNLGISLLVPGFPSLHLVNDVDKSQLEPSEAATQLACSLRKVLSEGWGGKEIQMRMFCSYLSWCLYPVFKNNRPADFRGYNTTSNFSSLRSDMGGMLPSHVKSPTPLLDLSGMSNELLKPDLLAEFCKLAVIRITAINKLKDVNLNRDMLPAVRTVSSMMAHSHEMWLSGDNDYALPCLYLNLMALTQSSSIPEAEVTFLPHSTPITGKPDHVPLKDKIQKVLGDMGSILCSIPEEDLSIVEDYLSCSSPSDGIELAKTTLRRHMLLEIAKHKQTPVVSRSHTPKM